MINKIKNIIQNKYYQYTPGEFLPVYSGGDLLNKRQFHFYKAKKASIAVADYCKAVHSNFKELQAQ